MNNIAFKVVSDSGALINFHYYASLIKLTASCGFANI